jgi:peptidoglycan/LPS O-acetylase OafA/YrhL
MYNLQAEKGPITKVELNKPERIKELDTLRGLAALSVVFFHFTMQRTEYNQIFKLGTTGVDLFFIISGFVIYMSLQNISKGIDFVINRFSRLYPTYWASVLFTFMLLNIHSLHDGTFRPTIFIELIGNLSMFQYYLGINDLDGPYWTMIIEMNFYIVMLVLFKFNLLKSLNTIGIVACSIIVILSHYFYDIKCIKLLFRFVPLLQFLPLFFAGTIFFKIYTDRTNLPVRYLTVVFCLLCQLLLFPHSGRSYSFISWPEYHLMLILYFVLFTLFVNNKLSFIVNKATLFMGKISFALYLTHQYVSLQFIIPVFYNKLGINFWIVTLFINLPIIIAIATIITYKIELPYSKKVKNYLRQLFNANRSSVLGIN